MRIISIRPYKEHGKTGGDSLVRELLDKMRQRGQLEGVEVDIDEGYIVDHKAESRDEEFLAKINLGMVHKVREYCDSGKYDAIITGGTMGVGFFAARMISRIPFAEGIHSAVHVASLIGERFSIIEATDPQALISRRFVQLYGLDNKLASVRYISRSSTYLMRLISKCGEKERLKDPDIQRVVDEMVAQCLKAIEEDRADTLIIGCTPMQLFLDEIRQQLDEAGYSEIQLIGEYSASLEMAKAMVNMKLVQAPRAFPSDSLKVKPEFR